MLLFRSLLLKIALFLLIIINREPVFAQERGYQHMAIIELMPVTDEENFCLFLDSFNNENTRLWFSSPTPHGTSSGRTFLSQQLCIKGLHTGWRITKEQADILLPLLDDNTKDYAVCMFVYACLVPNVFYEYEELENYAAWKNLRQQKVQFAREVLCKYASDE
jgi:hypothetical protein